MTAENQKAVLRRILRFAFRVSCFVLLLCASAHAQYTNVTATIVDPNGIPYAFGTVTAQLTPSSSNPTLQVSNAAQCKAGGFGSSPCQVQFSGTYGPSRLDINGNLNMALPDNTLITPASTQWTFIVSLSPGIPLPEGVGGVQFSTAITISGASQSISSNLNSAATALKQSTFANINNVLWVDGIRYTTLCGTGGCLAAIPSTGGVCMVPPNYTETLSANCTISKSNTMIHFACPWKVNAGTNQLIIASTVSKVTIESDCAQSGAATEWNYTGSGKAWAVGDTSGSNGYIRVKNVLIDISGGANTASGFYATAVNNSIFDHLSVFCSGAGNGQTGMVCDGTGSGTYCGDNTWINPVFSSCATGWLGTGSGINAANANVVIDPNSSATPGIAMDFEASSTGNTIIAADFEGATTAFKFGGGADGNRCSLWQSSNTTDFNFGSGTFNNECEVIGPHAATPTVVDLGLNNRVKLQPNSNSLTFQWGCNGTATSSQTLFMNSTGAAATTCTSVTQNGTVVLISSAGIMKNFYVNAVTGGVNASSGVFTVQQCVGGNPAACSFVNTTVTCTTGTSKGCSDTTHFFSVAAGDLVGVKYTTQASETLATINTSIEKH